MVHSQSGRSILYHVVQMNQSYSRIGIEGCAISNRHLRCQSSQMIGSLVARGTKYSSLIGCALLKQYLQAPLRTQYSEIRKRVTKI